MEINEAVAPFSPWNGPIDGEVRAGLGQFLRDNWPREVEGAVQVELTYWANGRFQVATTDTFKFKHVAGYGIVVM